ncbi:hypothetical protein PINS_up005564 [Pythium insidiosum]|nr:hypothetical protein PINS_up005564 [Pythium insidiosum]
MKAIDIKNLASPLQWQWSSIASNWSVASLEPSWLEAQAHVVVLLSELQHIVATSPFVDALKDLDRDVVFNRSMNLAFASLEKLTTVVGVVEDEVRLHVKSHLVPWSCRARNQLKHHWQLIGQALVLAVLLGLMYRKWVLYKSERALIDRLVKEVRWFLLGRTQRTERFYPANHLRDNLFDTLPGVSPRNRTWLRDHVWPKVAALVTQDSRVSSRIATVHGNHMVVWEWISSHSPQKSVSQDLLDKKRKRNQRKRYSI